MISDSLLAFGNSAVSIIIGHISTEFVAANAIIATIVRLSTVFSGGLGSASATIAGNAIGRGETERAYREGVTSVTLSVIIGLFAGVIILMLSPWIISMYNITETTRAIAEQLMYAVAMMVVFQAMQGVLTKGVLRGGGDTHFLMVVDVLFLWILSIPI
jgi:Na+-driven multidrug efflux pump